MRVWAGILMVVASVAAGSIGIGAEPERPTVEQAQKALEADLEALHGKGEPARAEDLDRPAVADAENAVLDLRAAIKSVNTESKALRAYDDLNWPLSVPLSKEQETIARAWVKECAPALKLIKSAMAKGKVNWKRPYTTPLIKVMLPDLSGMRMLANILQPAALVAHADGDDIAALEHVRELLFLSRAAGDEPFLVSHLVGLGIDALACDVCRRIGPTLQLGKEPAMREQLRRTIAELLDETEVNGHMRRAMQGERLCQVDLALALAAGKMTLDELAGASGSGRAGGVKDLGLKPEEVAPIALTDARILLGAMARVVDAGTAGDLPTALTKMKPWPPPERMDPKKHFYVAMMAPSLEKGFAAHYTGLANRRLAATALAIRWYAMDHDGKVPQTLQDLVPAYLPTVPADPMVAGGAPLIYVPDDELVYSVGVDGQDDGGDAGNGTTRGRDIVMPLR